MGSFLALRWRGLGGLERAFLRAHGPTWCVALAVYGGWAALTFWHRALPLPALAALGGLTLAWQGSLQHETIHGHPGGPPWVRQALGAPPLSLWLPYAVYRETHRRHHATGHLTDPSHDPESPFVGRAEWSAFGPLRRALARSQRTALGRLALGPAITIGRFLAGEAEAIARGAPGRRRAWAAHALGVAAVLAWLLGVAAMPLSKYLVAFVYPGAALTLVRSFGEHRYDREPGRRTTVVEGGWLFRLIFLNNNFHVVHHRSPHLPWFALPARWRREREAFVSAAPDLVYAGYLALLRAHALRPLSRPELP